MVLNLSLVLLAVPGADAQAGQNLLYEFDLEVPYGPHEVPINGVVNVPVILRDNSRDGTATVVPDDPSGLVVFAHNVEWQMTSMFENDQGWVAQPMTGYPSFAGDARESTLTVLAGPTTTNPYFKLNLTAAIRTDGGIHYRTAQVLFYTPGIAGFAVRSAQSFDLGPREIGAAGLIVTNVGVFPRAFEAQVVENPCNLRVTPPPTTLIPGRTVGQMSFSLQGPEDRLLYLTENCSLRFVVVAIDNPDREVGAIVSVVVNGWYVDPTWIFWAVAAITALILLLLFVTSRKARIEEELLGKPQKPWTIPVEKVYLDRLKESDPHAWYVVRHYLMEDEYRSALMWYQAFKRGTKNQRAKERMIVAQEKGYQRWRARELRKADKPILAADRFEAKLQKKLDRSAAKRHRKERSKWAALVKKVTEAHAKKVEKAEAKWSVAAKKARKRGQPEPEKPDLGEPDLPEEPMLVQVPLEEHKWARKADRFRGKMDRKNERMLQRFERADARRLDKVRRKARRAAKKLDDPDFVDEHPLLLGDAPS